MTLLVVGSYAAPLLRGTPVPPEVWTGAVGTLLQRVCPIICTMIFEDRIIQEGLVAALDELPASLPSLTELLGGPSMCRVAPRLVLLYALLTVTLTLTLRQP